MSEANGFVIAERERIDRAPGGWRTGTLRPAFSDPAGGKNMDKPGGRPVRC